MTRAFGVDYEAAARNRRRQALLVDLTDSDHHAKGGRRLPLKGNPKEVTDAMLLERVWAEAEKAAALAPERLSIEEPA